MSTISVEVDVDEVIDAVSTYALVDELKARASTGDGLAKSAVGHTVVDGLSQDDIWAARAAILEGDAETFMALVGPVFDAETGRDLAAAYAALKRDPRTGRPVIQ